MVVRCLEMWIVPTSKHGFNLQDRNMWVEAIFTPTMHPTAFIVPVTIFRLSKIRVYFMCDLCGIMYFPLGPNFFLLY